MRGMRGVRHVLESSAGRFMLLGPPGLLAVPGVLRGRPILGVLKIIARAGLAGVIAVGAIGVVSVVHVVAHSRGAYR